MSAGKFKFGESRRGWNVIQGEEAEYLLPTQWADLYGTPADEPERALFQAVLFAAFRQVQRYRKEPDPSARRIVAEVLEWIRDLDGRWAASCGQAYPITFRMACDFGFHTADADVLSRSILRHASTFCAGVAEIRCHFVPRSHHRKRKAA